MEAEISEAPVIFTPCIKWVRRGVAQSHPLKIELSKQELEDVIRQTRASLHVNDDEDSGTDVSNAEAAPPPAVNPDDEFNMEAYDDEDGAAGPRLADVAQLDTEGFVVEDNEREDSENEDEIIKPNDNLIVVGRVEGDASVLEVYVQNEDEGSLYVHHDILLSSMPLCLEWLNYDPEYVHQASNLCAVGCMDPIIQVWDLDVINSIEPAYKLGRKKSKKKRTPPIGHTNAVLDISWNLNLTHILASGSVDQKVILWDLEVKLPSSELTDFNEKVQSLKWHGRENHTLLTGCADKKVKVWDCRSKQQKSWPLLGEVERVCWDNLQEQRFFASDSEGYFYLLDTRQNAPIWSQRAHDSAVTGLQSSQVCLGLVVTIGESGLSKLWDFVGPEPVVVMEKFYRVGQVQCLDLAPEMAFQMAVGGDNRNHNFVVQSLEDLPSIKQRFGERVRTALPQPADPLVPSTSASSSRCNVKVREKRPRSGERVLKAKKKPKKLNPQ